MSSYSVLVILAGTVLHALSISWPRILPVLNFLAAAMYLAGLAWLSNGIAPMVLSNTCSKTIWIDDMGVMVCRIYKALYSFVAIGTACALCMVLLDARAHGERGKMGVYRQLQDEKKDAQRGLEVDHAAGGLSDWTPLAGSGRTGARLRDGEYLELKESPELELRGTEDAGDMGRVRVKDGNELFLPPTPGLSEYEGTPRLT
jgi:hypothetical protein